MYSSQKFNVIHVNYFIQIQDFVCREKKKEIKYDIPVPYMKSGVEMYRKIHM